MLPLDPEQPKVDTNQDVPKEMDVFYRSESSFLPEGKTWQDLTQEEIKEIQNKYRFDVYKPGIYQAITWKGKI